MAEETQIAKGPNKRNIGKSKGSKARKKAKKMPHSADGGGRGKKPKKIDPKTKKLYRKRAREYNSSSEGEDEDEAEMSGGGSGEEEEEEHIEEGGGGRLGGDDGLSEGEEDDEVQPGITKLAEGSNAFRLAFRSILNKTVADDVLGPVLSGHKKLVAEKLAEEKAERKVKGEAKKEKQLVTEKGHIVAPQHDSHEKFLMKLATGGVVKLFNAVSRAQNVEKGLNPDRSKHAKEIRKQRKKAFFTELGKPSAFAKGQTSKGSVDSEGPSWAPLRDNFMLTNSKLKDWDKKHDKVGGDDFGRMSEDSSSEDD